MAVSNNMVKAKKEFDACFELMKTRSLMYGDSWKGAKLTSLVDYAVMKYKRVSKMVEYPSVNIEKVRSDLQDMVNYAIFALIKLREVEKR